MLKSGSVATLEQAPDVAPSIAVTPQRSRPRRIRTSARQAWLPAWAVASLLLTAAVSLLTSHYRFLDGDDLLELWCDRVPSFGQLIHIQSALPLVIDPFFFHGITFAGVRLFGLNPVLLRLPSLLGFLLMQVCLFCFVRRLASERAAMFALAFPLITCAFGFTCALRPYCVLLGLFGLAMLSWQTATRRQTHRAWALATLALAVAAAINTHYYGVLVLAPLYIAELVRSLERKRLDIPVLLSIGTGMCGIVFLLPFLKGAAEFRSHYRSGPVSLNSVTQTYNFLLFGQSTFSKSTNHLLAAVLGLLMLVVVWSCIHQMRRKTLVLPNAEFAFLATLAALPFFCFLLARFVTHATEPRYALGSILGIAALLSIALAPLLQSRSLGRAALLLVFAAFLNIGVRDIRTAHAARQASLASFTLSPKIEAAIMATPSRLLYTEDIDLFGFAAFHDPDPDVRSHMALVYSPAEEMLYHQSKAGSRIALHLKSFTQYPILPYESLSAQPEPYVFIVDEGGWNWIEEAFAAEHVDIQPLGQAFGSEVVSVRFRRPEILETAKADAARLPASINQPDMGQREIAVPTRLNRTGNSSLAPSTVPASHPAT